MSNNMDPDQESSSGSKLFAKVISGLQRVATSKERVNHIDIVVCLLSYVKEKLRTYYISIYASGRRNGIECTVMRLHGLKGVDCACFNP